MKDQAAPRKRHDIRVKVVQPPEAGFKDTGGIFVVTTEVGCRDSAVFSV